MKNNKFAKISLLVLSLVICIGAMFAMSINAEGTEKKPEIISQNVAYTDKFSLMYAVDASTVAEAPVTLYLYEVYPQGEATYKTKYEAATVTTGLDSGLGVDAYIFTTDGVGATAMTQEFFVQAEDAAGNKSDVKKYSVAEYLYERLATTGDKAPNDDQKQFYNDTINFGTNAQLILAPEGTTLLSDYRYVTVEGGTVDGYAKGIYEKDSKQFAKIPGAIGATWNITTTNAAGETTTVTSEGLFTVADDSIKTEISLVEGTVKNYDSAVRSSVENGAIAKYISGSATKSIVEDFTYGQVTKYVFGSGGYMDIAKTDTAVTADKATAFECSFDMKLVLPGDYANERVEFIMRSTNNSNCHRTELFDVSDREGHLAGEGQIHFRNAASGVSQGHKVFDGFDTSDWVHYRVVIYEGDTNCYIYVNGQADPMINTKIYSDKGFENYNSFRIITEVNGSATSAGSECYITNVFCGFTTAENPFAAPEVTE